MKSRLGSWWSKVSMNSVYGCIELQLFSYTDERHTLRSVIYIIMTYKQSTEMELWMLRLDWAVKEDDCNAWSITDPVIHCKNVTYLEEVIICMIKLALSSNYFVHMISFFWITLFCENMIMFRDNMVVGRRTKKWEQTLGVMRMYHTDIPKKENKEILQNKQENSAQELFSRGAHMTTIFKKRWK